MTLLTEDADVGTSRTQVLAPNDRWLTSMPILASKLAPPTITRPNVVRHALLDRLDRSSSKVIAIVAPAGWGKTTLLSDWRSRADSSSTAWLSLEAADNDPIRFWSYVVAALRVAIPGCGAAALSLLTAPGAGIAESVLPELLNELAQLRSDVVLVLDDYHLVSNTEVLRTIEFLVRHLPATVRLVLATRADPNLPLARLRVGSDLCEVRASDLRFTDAETASLFNDVMGLGLTADDIIGLHRRTEGWAAGLCMVGLSLRNRPEPSRFIETFAGDDRQVADYMLTEVMDGLTLDMRSFLEQTSILERMSAVLCDAVVGRTGSQRKLEELERSNLFLVPLDDKREWYRYHHLFGELLRAQLHRTSPALEPVLHRRASRWHSSHGTITEAVNHAMSGGELVGARELIVANWNLCFNEGLVATVQSWLEQLPREMILADARLCLTQGWVARHQGRLDEIEPWVQAAETGVAQGPLTDDITTIESSACLLRAGHRHMIGDLEGAEASARRAMELEALGAPRWRAAALVTFGATLGWQGKDDEAVALLNQVVPEHRAPINNLGALWAHGCLAAIAARSGDLNAAQHHVQRASDLAARHGLGESSMGAAAILTSADILRGRGQAVAAESQGRRGLELAQRGQARLETAWGHLSLSLTLRRGQPRESRAHLDRAGKIVATCAAPGMLTQLLEYAAALCNTTPYASTAQSRQTRDPLSKRETGVLHLLSSDLSLREIAFELFVSYNTVKSQTRAIYRKLGVSTRADAVARSRENEARTS